MPRSVGRSTVRPLTGIALKSCIDTLRPLISGASICDLFAGEGRFALACRKEGARQLVLVEQDRHQCSRLENLCQASNTILVREDVFQFLRRTKEVFDIIFCDPPFPDWSQKFAAELCQLAFSRLSEEGIFLVKSPKRMVVFKEGQAFKVSQFGESQLSYFKKK